MKKPLLCFIAFIASTLLYAQGETFDILPLKLQSFSASPSSGVVKVKWTSAEEVNMDHFELQRSTDGVNFTAITNVPCNNRTEATAYTYVDAHPQKARSYYRLKMISLGTGESKYSPVAAVSLEKAGMVSLYPTLIPEGHPIKIMNADGEALQIEFCTNAGRKAGSVNVSSSWIPSNQVTMKGQVYYCAYDKNGVIKGKGQLFIR